ncbi:MAG: prenyltransferase/squalene oxidase repeat-containing protein [Chloroflexota bacterium]
MQVQPKCLKGDPLPWLLEPENPSVRYWTLTDILHRPADDPEVHAARATISTYPPVAELLAAQKPDGYWVKRDYYLPKNYGTFWVLSVLADLGLTAENEHVRRGCQFLFAQQREHGGFCRHRHIPGQGNIWKAQAEPCTQARIVRFLIQFGYADDPRTQAAVDWLLATQRDDAMWLCSHAGRRGCLRATLDYLRVAALDPATAAHPATARAAAVVYDLLMEPRMGRYHVGDLWMILEYPYFGYSVISALEALARLGYRPEQPKVAVATEYLLSRQLPDGTWPLDQSAPHPPFDVGQPGEPNKWLTLDALRVIKLFHNQG